MKIAKAFSVTILVLLKIQGVLSEKKEEGRRLSIKRTERSSSKLRKEGDKSVRKRLAVSDDPGEPPMSLEALGQYRSQTYYNENMIGERGQFCRSDDQCVSPYNCDHQYCGGIDNGWVCHNDNECRPGVSCAGKSYDHTGYCGGGWNTAPCSHDDHCINICIDGYCGRAAEDGESCSEDRECLINQCLGNICMLLEDGESCSEDRECLINQCLGNICMLPVGIGGTCDSSPQCQGNLVCRSRTCVLLRYPGQSCSAPNMLCGGGQLCSSGRCSGRNNGSRCQTRYQCNSRSCRGSFSNSRCSSMPLRVNNFSSHNHRRCEGNCYRDNNCIGSLSCFRTNGRTSVPGCDDDRIWSNRNRGFCIERL